MNDNRTTGLVLLGLGALFLVTQVFNISLFGLLWPLIVLLPGLPFLYAALNSQSDNNAGLIFPGLIVTGTGLILLYQNITGHWESWAYIWILYPILVGVGLRFQGTRTGDHDEIETGTGMVKYGLMALAGFAFFFEVLIFGTFTSLLWPLVLLGGGAYLLLKSDSTDHDRLTTKRKNVDIEKPKHEYTGPSAAVHPDLQRKIDAALAEDSDDMGTMNGEPRQV